MLLVRLEQLVVDKTLAVAHHAASTLGHEGIYGFWLLCEVFAMFDAVVFTEAALDEALRHHGSETRDSLRWGGAAGWHHRTEFDDTEIQNVVGALEAHPLTDSHHEEVKRISLRALRRVREAGVLHADVILTVTALGAGPEQTFASAEPFCDAIALLAFRRHLSQYQGLDEEALRQFRPRIPSF